MKERSESGITVKKSENFMEWYLQVLSKSNFMDYTDVSGCIVFKPAAYGAWQTIMNATDAEFKKAGIENVYFPLLIPEKLLKKEQEHMEGFAPEVAWVTQSGETKFQERLAIRPTSEAIMYASYSKWVRSWRDLPIRHNQWNNALRWEFKHPTPFLRSREFLWNEGHSVFATEKEANAERDVILGIYMKILREYLALPVILGIKSDKEKFAGAVATYSTEHVMPDGWAIQGPDFHSDGQNFAKAFDIKFLDKEGNIQHAWQNTYAITTRELGVMVATHSDDKGLVLPPRLAYIQVVIVPILKKENAKLVDDYARKVQKQLGGEFRVRMDDREGYSPGYKFNDWELRGIPVRIEIGQKEVEAEKVVLVRRDTGEKTECKLADAKSKVEKLLSDIHENMYAKAEKFLKANIHAVSDYAEFKKVLSEKGGMIHAPWCGSRECEESIKEQTGAKITNIPFDEGKLAEKCIYCGKKAKHMANFAKSY
ncbi:TPA: proline--tRNA ligase [Candidatus Micrarchaeota archaeon]|nr:proline--tRNA ligase [Candidatus Micrarchaeota archaeon]